MELVTNTNNWNGFGTHNGTRSGPLWASMDQGHLFEGFSNTSTGPERGHKDSWHHASVPPKGLKEVTTRKQIWKGY